ncbi:hypothetical protein ACFL3C_00050 [Patescibacteria group bacterium]
MKIRKFFAGILVLMFAIITLPTLFVQSITSTYLNAGFYEGPVIDKSYDYLASFLNNEISKDDEVTEYLASSDVKEIIEQYFPKQAFQEIAQDFVSQLKSVNDERRAEDITVSLLPLKEHIDDLAADVAYRVVDSIPTCENFDEEDLATFTQQDGLPSCIPPQIERSELEDPMRREIKRAMQESIPDRFSPVVESSGGGGEEEVGLHQVVSVFQYIHLILPLFLLILLLLIMLIIYKPYTSIMKFVGSALALGGVFGLIAAQLMSQIPTYISEYAYDEAEIDKLRELYKFLFAFVTDKMTIYSIFFAGCGALIIFFGIYLKHHHSVQKSLDA